MKSARKRKQTRVLEGGAGIDARILGQILTAQNILFALPNNRRIAEFFAQVLASIPEVSSCRVCLGDVSIQVGDMSYETCARCEEMRRLKGDSFAFSLDAMCGLEGRPNIYSHTISSSEHSFGFFTFHISNPNVFDAYWPFIGNLANYVALSLENRMQKDLLQNAHDEMERKVEKRTRELMESEKQTRQLFDFSPVAMLIAYGMEERVEAINDKFIELFGYTLKDIPDVAHWWPLAYPDDKYRESIKSQWMAKVEIALTQKSQIEPMDATVTCKDGSQRYVEFRLSSIGQRHLVTFVDLTERRQTEQALRESEEKFRALIEQSLDGVALLDEQGNVIEWNQANVSMTGLSHDDVLGVPLWDVMMETIPPEKRTSQRHAELKRMIQQALKTGKSDMFLRPIEAEFYPRHSSEKHYVHQTVFPVETEKGFRIASLSQDITERRQSEQRIKQLASIVESSDDAIISKTLDGVILSWNAGAENIYGYAETEMIGRPIAVLVPPGRENEIPKILEKIAAGEHIEHFETIRRRKDGREISISLTISPIQDADGRVVAASTIGRDITERKQTEKLLKKSEEKFRALADNIPNVIYQCKNDSRYTFLYLNDAVEKLTGYPKEEFLEKGLSFFDLYHPDDLATMPTPEENNITDINRRPFHVIYRIRHKSGDWRWVDEWGTGVMNSSGEVEFLEGVMIDITERKRHELEREAIIAVSTALRRATTRAEILSVILDQLMDLFEADGATLVLPDPQTGGFVDEMGRGVVGKRMTGLIIPPGKGVCSWVIANKKPYLTNDAYADPIFYRPDLLEDSRCIASVPLVAQEQAFGALWIARRTEILESELRLLSAVTDIAANAIHRVMLHEQTELQLRHLTALHQIDLAISTNFDLNITFQVLLRSVQDELDADAASVLLLDSVTHTLDYAAGIGFRTHGIEKSRVKLGDGCAGRAAHECSTVACLDIRSALETYDRSAVLVNEEFVSHYATPLVIKGQVKGVLEVFQRKNFSPTQEWTSYFEILATQAAIAIESTSLFENLQRSNMELTLAYDATIEGWSRALDLRDKETEGHTQRVTEMVLALAAKMGMSDMERMDIRRGALLHDIGKMGVPDSILNKPGDLTPDEWRIMRQHPMYAYQMLSPISYLKYALDIPYCHHEKWDGSGYPRGLKGEEIPLPARMFAVVDVFDALTSDRPYRAAWSSEQTYRYIREQSGKHFDPRVVKIFLEGK